MIKNRIIIVLSILVIVLVWCSAGMGIFYSNEGSPRFVDNIYGETVQLFGDGVYANNSMQKATTSKGTDIVMLFVSLGLLITLLKRNSGGPKVKLLHGGFLASLLYYAANMAFGITYSKMFLIYLAMFSVTLFAFIATLIHLNTTIQPTDKDRKFAVIAIFTMVAGCTVLVWLMSILPTIFTDVPLDIIEIYTTEPTFIIDIGLILPTCILGGILLLQKKTDGIYPATHYAYISCDYRRYSNKSNRCTVAIRRDYIYPAGDWVCRYLCCLRSYCCDCKYKLYAKVLAKSIIIIGVCT